MERKSLNELINEIEAKQAELENLNNQLKELNHTATNNGCDMRVILINEMRKALDEIEETTNAIKNY